MIYFDWVITNETHFNCGRRAGYSGAAARLPGGCRLPDCRGWGWRGSPGSVWRADLRPGSIGPDAPENRRLWGLRADPPAVPGPYFDAHRPGWGRIAAPGFRYGHRRLCDQALLHAGAAGKDPGHPPPPWNRRGGQPPAVPGPDFGSGHAGGPAGRPAPGPDRPGV